MAVDIVEESNAPSHVIFSDSYSVLRTLANTRETNPIGRKILHDTHRLHTQNNISLKLCWIPSHVGIPGNEMADKAAVAAAEALEQYITLYYQDWYPIIQRKIEQEWKEEWQTSRQKLKEIKS